MKKYSMCNKKLLGSFCILIFLLSITLINIKTYNEQTIETFDLIEDNTVIKKDFNGDGEKDILYIKKHNEKYYIQINIKSNSYELIPNNDLRTLGSYSITWPIRITLKDLNRDNLPEIILQSTDDNIPIQHIFSWDVDKFKNIFNSKNNIIGFNDTSNNKSPKFISGNFYNGEMYFKNYMLINKKTMNYSANYPNDFLGKETVTNFINFLQGNADIKEKVVLSMEEPLIDQFFQLSTNGYKLTFQDAIFEDLKSAKNGDIKDIKWKLNFKGSNSEGVKNFTITLQLRERLKDKNKEYIIYYINTENLM